MVGVFLKNTTLCGKILHFVVKHSVLWYNITFLWYNITFCGTISQFIVLLWYICGIFVIYLWYFLLWVPALNNIVNRICDKIDSVNENNNRNYNELKVQLQADIDEAKADAREAVQIAQQCKAEAVEG